MSPALIQNYVVVNLEHVKYSIMRMTRLIHHDGVTCTSQLYILQIMVGRGK